MRIVSLPYSNKRGASSANNDDDGMPQHIEVDGYRGSDADLAATRNTKRGMGRTERLFNMRAHMAGRANAARGRMTRRGGRGGRTRGRSVDDGGYQRSRRSSIGDDPMWDRSESERSESPAPLRGGGRSRSAGRRSGRSLVPVPPSLGRSMNTLRSFNPLNSSSNNNNNNDRGGGDEETAGSSHGGSRGSRTSARKRSERFRAHPWILPPHLRLAPRVDVWFAFAVSSCAAVASIGQIKRSTRGENNNYGGGFAPWDDYALSACAISFAVTFSIAAGMRYAPLRTALTKALFPAGTSHPPLLVQARLTAELLALSFLAILWTLAMPTIVNGDAYYSANRDVPLAMAGSDIWNANLYYSSWASFLLCAYLWVEVFTLQNRRGTLRVDSSNSSGPAQTNNVLTKRWTLLFLNGLVLMSASIGTYVSPSCQGNLLKETPYCSRALLGIIVGGLFQLLIAFGVAVLYRLSHMSPAVLNSRIRQSRLDGAGIMSESRRNAATAVAGFVSLFVQAVNAAMLTNPVGGGPGSISGTLYFGSWLGFVLAFEMCLRYLELFSTSGRGYASCSPGSVGGSRRGGCSASGDAPTVFADSESGSEGVLMLEEDNFVVEDASDEEEVETQHSAMHDAQSFVFSYTAKPSDQIEQLAVMGGASVKSRRSEARSRRRQGDPSPDQESRRSRGGGIDPEEYSSERPANSRPSSRGSSGSRSRRNRKDSPSASLSRMRKSSSTGSRSTGKSPSDVGSIDARPQYCHDASRNNEPDAAYGRSSSRYFNSSGNLTDNDTETNTENGSEDYFDAGRRPQSFPNRRPTEDPIPKTSFPSFNMNQVEKLDDIPGTRAQQPQPRQRGQQPEPGPTAAQISQVAHQLRGQREDSDPLMRTSTATNLSPLEEGSQDVSPNTGTDNNRNSSGSAEAGPPTVDGETEEVVQKTLQQQLREQQVGDNLRNMQVTSRGLHPADRSKKGSVASKKSGGSSRKKSPAQSSLSTPSTQSGGRSKGLSPALGAGGSSSKSHSQGRGYGGSKSRQSGRSTASRKTMSSYASSRESAILTDHSEQGGPSSGRNSRSTGSRFNQLGVPSSRSKRSQPSHTSTMSSHGVSTTSPILTDDEESGSNPPPTISDGMSTRDGSDISGFSALSKKSGSQSANQNDQVGGRRSSGPPPPPFRRSPAENHDYGDGGSAYSSSGAPVRSIHTGKGSNGDDTIVSDPTLDAGLDQSPKPSNARKESSIATNSKSASTCQTNPPPPPHHPHRATADDQGFVNKRHSSSTNSYDKKYSDETERQSSESDANPSSHEGGDGDKVVDNIVAAALAYAEKTHSETDTHGLSAATGGASSSHHRPQPPPPGLRSNKSRSLPHQPAAGRKKKKQQQQHGAEGSTVRSFFTDTDADGEGGGNEGSAYGASHASAPVEDLVAKALNHAQGQLDGRGIGGHGREGAQAPLHARQQSGSGYSSNVRSRTSESVGSMYSEDDTEYTGQGVGMHYDC